MGAHLHDGEVAAVAGPLGGRDLGERGDPVRVEGSELLARAIQHETDHLDGVLFVDRLDAEARAAALDVLQGAEWQGAQAWLPDGSPVPAPVVKVSPH